MSLTMDEAARAKQGLSFGSQLTGPLPVEVSLPLGKNAKGGATGRGGPDQGRHRQPRSGLGQAGRTARKLAFTCSRPARGPSCAISRSTAAPCRCAARSRSRRDGQPREGRSVEPSSFPPATTCGLSSSAATAPTRSPCAATWRTHGRSSAADLAWLRRGSASRRSRFSAIVDLDFAINILTGLTTRR